MIRLGLYTPTPKGWLSIGTAHTMAQDTAWSEWDAFDISEVVRPGNSIEVGRNQAVLRAAETACTHLRMLDADVWCPWGHSVAAELWNIMRETEATAVGAVVPVHGGKDGKLNVYPVKDDPVYECQHVSAAAMLIDLRALARLDWPAKTPFFARQYNPAMTLCTLDEGYFFSSHLRASGGTIVACNVPIQHGSDVRRSGR